MDTELALERLKRLRELKQAEADAEAQARIGDPRNSKYRKGARANQLPPNGDWRIWVIKSGRGFGKALALDTPIPTPTGWTTMGDLEVGDQVFSADGSVTTVTFHTGPQYGRTCYRITFSDGASIVADADHQWSARARKDRRANRPYRTVTTAEMLDAGLTVAKESNWQMPCANAVQLPDADLPIDPWVLGFWLGDGTNTCASITVGEKDRAEIYGLLEAHGEPPTGKERGDTTRTVVVGGRPEARDELGRVIYNGSLHGRLRQMRLLGNKHIPAVYLRASEKQRTDLLSGLIDSDGWVDHSRGIVEITTIKEHLAEQYAELIRSLGHKVKIYKGRATLYGRDCGPKYRVTFNTRSGGGLLERKQMVDRNHLGQPNRITTRYVANIEPVESVPVACITVDHPSSLYLAGRDWLVTHNTWTGSGLLLEWAIESQPLEGVPQEFAVCAPTYNDVRRICIEGPSGILKMAPKNWIRRYNRSTGEITLANGAKIHAVSADEPDRARGLNLSGLWADELSSWRYDETWYEGFIPALRIGNPRVIVTTTPKPTKLMRDLLGRTDGSVVVTSGSTFDNAANLSNAALEELRLRYEGTRLGRQELYGELLEDVEGALWTHDMILRTRFLPDLTRIIVAIDPAVSSGPDSDETGIVVVAKGIDGRGYVLADRTCRESPLGWASRAIQAYEEFGADRIVAEKNQGGEMVEQTLRSVNPSIAYTGVVAKHGKRLRAEPIAALYERGMVSHHGIFDELERQMLEWLPDSGESPDRLDALVHGFTQLGLTTSTGASGRFFEQLAPPCPKCQKNNHKDATRCSGCGELLIDPEPQVHVGHGPWPTDEAPHKPFGIADFAAQR